MIANRDIYADKHGRITDDPAEFAVQVAVRGCFLDPRIAQRFGIEDSLVSTSEPRAVRRVTARNASSVTIVKAEEKAAAQPETKEPQEPAEAVEPKAESEPEAKATGQDAPKPTAKKGEIKTS